MAKNRIFFLLIIIIGAVFLIVDFAPEEQLNTEYSKFQGGIFGTTYSIIYLDSAKRDFSDDIQNALLEVNSSLSTYDPNSTLSKINNNSLFDTDPHFRTVFNQANTISAETDGAFDITVGPIVRFWGFGFDANKIEVNTVNKLQIDSLLDLCGYEKVHLNGGLITKHNENTRLDASAIAKGYGVDVAAKLLSEKGVKNFMVEIGGEINCKGKNPKGEHWKIGVDKPIEDPTAMQRKLQTVLSITDAAMATSGSYRQFYYKNNKRYSHTINPKTGFPVDHNLLSATVIAPNCMLADAYATACMVMGVDESLALAKRKADLEVYLLFENADGEIEAKYSSGFKNLIVE